MSRHILGFFVASVVHLSLQAQALECGIANHLNEEELQNTLRKCMSRLDLEDEAVSSESSEETGHQTKTKIDNVQDNATTIASDKCVLQCIFNELEMVDDNGYPAHRRVVEGLLKNADGRELRDFLQDSADECFQLIRKDENLNACDFSTRLTKCLAEKGRSNCADWETTNLPFHQN